MKDEPNEAVEQAKARAQRTAAAFLAVFGRTGKRSENQTVVLGHLEICAGDSGNSYRFNEAKDGLALIAAGIHRDGARSILRVIERQVDLAANAPLPAPKPKTKR